MFSSPSYSEWTLFDNPQSKEPTYLDFKNAKIRNDNIKIWGLVNHSNDSGSTTILTEMDCENYRIRRLFFNNHGDKWGKGGSTASTVSDTKKKWNLVSPLSEEGEIISRVCNKLIKR